MVGDNITLNQNVQTNQKNVSFFYGSDILTVSATNVRFGEQICTQQSTTQRITSKVWATTTLHEYSDVTNRRNRFCDSTRGTMFYCFLLPVPNSAHSSPRIPVHGHDFDNKWAWKVRVWRGCTNNKNRQVLKVCCFDMLRFVYCSIALLQTSVNLFDLYLQVGAHWFLFLCPLSELKWP